MLRNPPSPTAPAAPGTAPEVATAAAVPVRAAASAAWARRHGRGLGALLALCIVLWLPRLAGPLDLRYDAGVYYVLGTSLAEGRGYRLLNEPGAIEAIQYPPLLPAMVAAAQRGVGTSDPAVAGHLLRLWFCALFFAYVVAVYVLAARFLPPLYAFLATLAAMLHVQAIWLSDLLFAELPYTLATVGVVLLAGWMRSTAAAERPVARRLAGAGAGTLAVAAYLLRSVGIALLAAWIGESVLRRRYRQAALRALVAALPVVLWQAHIARVESGPEYAHPAYAYQRADYQYYNVGYVQNALLVDPFIPELGRLDVAGFALRVGRNLVAMPAAWGEAVSSRREWARSQVERLNTELLPWPLPLWLVTVPMVLLGAGIFVGLLRLARHGEWLLALYVAGAVALVCITPWPGQFERYLAPLTPFFAIALFVALAAVPARGSGVRSARTVLLAATAAVVLGQEAFAAYKVYTKHHRPVEYTTAAGVRQEQRMLFYTQAWRRHDAALDWLREHATPGAVVATATPHWAYLRTGLPAVMPPFEPDPTVAQRLTEAVPVEYLIVDALEFLDITRRYAAPMVRTFPERWELLYAPPDSGSWIYRRRALDGIPTPP